MKTLNPFKTHSFIRIQNVRASRLPRRSILQNIAVDLKSLLLSRLGSTTFDPRCRRERLIQREEEEKRRGERRVGLVVLQEGCGWSDVAPRGTRRWLHVADTRGTDSDSRRTVPLSVVTSPSWWCWCWHWWWCYGRLCLAFLPRSTNRDEPPVHARRRVARFLATVRPALPFPFLPACSSSLSLSFSLFPFFSLFRSCTHQRPRPWPRRASRLRDRETLPRAAPPTLSRAFPTCDGGTLPSISIPRREIKALVRYA